MSEDKIEKLVALFNKLKNKKDPIGDDDFLEDEEEGGLPAEKIKKMKAHEAEETEEDEDDESDEYQAMEDKYGIEKHKPSLFGKKKNPLSIIIAMGKK